MSERNFERDAQFVLEQLEDGWEIFSSSFRTTWVKRELKWLGVTYSDQFVDLIKRAIADPEQRRVGKTDLVRLIAAMEKARRRQLRIYSQKRRKQLQAHGSRTFDAPCGRLIVESFVPIWTFTTDFGVFAIYRPIECVNECQQTGLYDICLDVTARQNWHGWDFADPEEHQAHMELKEK